MATIKTIKPAGGGDYTTLQAWWDTWVEAPQATADQWAECYSGGDLGTLDMGGISAPTPDATNYYRIYTPLAERHTGKDDGVGAYISITGVAGISAIYGANRSSYLRVEGIKVEINGGWCAVVIGFPMASSFLADSNYIIHKSGTDTSSVGIDGTWMSTGGTGIVRNNIINGGGNYKISIGVSIIITEPFGGNAGGTYDIYNNSVRNVVIYAYRINSNAIFI